MAGERLGIDVLADLNAEDDDGLGWSARSDARDAARVRVGTMPLVGNESAVVRIVAVGDDGQIHFSVLPRSVAQNRHPLDRISA